MINLKGFRKISIDNKVYLYRPNGHEKAVVYTPDKKIFYIHADNDVLTSSMHLPRNVSAKIKEHEIESLQIG